MWLTVGCDKAIAAEVLIAARPFWTEIAPKGPEGLLPGLGGLKVTHRQRLLPLAEALIHPVPHEATLEVGLAVDLLPIKPHIPTAVAHGVGVFAHDEGPGLHLGGVLGEPTGRATSAYDIRVGLAILIVDRTVGIAVLDPFAGGLEVRRPPRCPGAGMTTDGWFLSRSTI